MESQTITLKTETISPNKVPYYSDKDLAYQLLDDRYKSFYKLTPNLESFKQAIQEKQKHEVDRVLLTEVIQEQYNRREFSNSQERNWNLLKDNNTFTVVTAHQPSLFTGPLYYIFKICSTIKLAQELNDKYSEYNFVPLFISGGEDHDFDEINHVHIFNKEVKWEMDVSGPVGRIPIDGQFEKIIDEFTAILGDQKYGEEIKNLLKLSRDKSTIYGEFNFHLANNLFSNYGLLVLGMDDRRLKSSFIPIMEKELLEMPSRGIVMETQTKLEKVGFSSQAYPRIINLFYLQDNLRSRIEKGGDKEYYVVDTNIQWSEEELLVELHEYPERFSPNVIMRPLYQEHTLPNLAYIGGGGEIAYWLERKDQFEFFKIPFPILMRRNSAMLVPTYIQDQINDLELDITTFFGDEDLIINNFLAEQTTIEIDLAEEKKDLEKVFDKIAWKAEQIDPPLAKWILAESTKNQKLVDQMESRIRRSIKKREENKVKQIRKVKNKLFPGNGLQERYDNFFQYYLEEGPSLIEKLIETFDPVSNDFYMIKL